jgi:soluble lytic murein transglycosylase-like protein
MRFLALLLLAGGAACAEEYAVLAAGGTRLHIDRHEIEDGRVRLYLGGGYVEMPAADVKCFEADDLPPVPAPIPAAVTAPRPILAPKPLTPLELADAAADKYGLPPKLVRAVMSAESAGQPNAVSPKGAIGLMQLMPTTAKELGVDPHDPEQNVDGGTRYLRDLLLKYDGFLWHALAAYNAGPGAVQKYGDIPPYPETLRYIKRIDRDYRR